MSGRENSSQFQDKLNSIEYDLYKDDFQNLKEMLNFYSTNFINLPCCHFMIENENFYHCKQCCKKKLNLYCNKCFDPDDHKGHDIYIHSQQGRGGFCDCGLSNSFVKPCKKHYQDFSKKLSSLDNDKYSKYLEIFKRMIDLIPLAQTNSEITILLSKMKEIYMSCTALLDCFADAFFSKYPKFIDILNISNENFRAFLQIGMLTDFCFSENTAVRYYPSLLYESFDTMVFNYQNNQNQFNGNSIMDNTFNIYLLFRELLFVCNNTVDPDKFFAHTDKDCIKILKYCYSTLSSSEESFIHFNKKFLFEYSALLFNSTKYKDSFLSTVIDSIHIYHIIRFNLHDYVKCFEPLMLFGILYDSFQNGQSIYNIQQIMTLIHDSCSIDPSKLSTLTNFDKKEELLNILISSYNDLQSNAYRYVISLLGSLIGPEKFIESFNGFYFVQERDRNFFYTISSIIFFNINNLSPHNFVHFNDLKYTKFMKFFSFTSSRDFFDNQYNYLIEEYPSNEIKPKFMDKFNCFTSYIDFSTCNFICQKFVNRNKMLFTIPDMLIEEQPSFLHCQEFIYDKEFQGILKLFANIDNPLIHVVIPVLQYVLSHATDDTKGQVFSKIFSQEDLSTLIEQYKIIYINDDEEQINQNNVNPNDYIGFDIDIKKGPLLSNTISPNQNEYRFICVNNVSDKKSISHSFLPIFDKTNDASFHGYAITFIYKCGGYRKCLEILLEEISIYEKRQLLNPYCFSNEKDFLFILNNIYKCINTARSLLEFYSSDQQNSEYDLYNIITSIILENKQNLFNQMVSKAYNSQNGLSFLRKAIIFSSICLSHSKDEIENINWNLILTKDNLENTFSVKIDDSNELSKYRFPFELPQEFIQFVKQPYDFCLAANYNKYICLLNGEIVTDIKAYSSHHYKNLYVPFLCYEGNYTSAITLSDGNNIIVLNTPYVNKFGIRNRGAKEIYNSPKLDEKSLDREIDNFLQARIYLNQQPANQLFILK